METPNTIRKILSRGESAHVEFKSAAAGLESIGETICAFLNSGGGQIIVGVRHDGKIESEVNAKKIESMLLPLSGGTEPGGLITPNAVWDVSEERTDEGSVAIIDVPAGGDCPYVFKDTIFVHSEGETRRASGLQTRRLIDKRYLQGARWERQPVLEVKLSDLDKDEILRTANVAVHKRGWRFRDVDDPHAILEDLNLIDHGRLTNAAVVLFAKQAGRIYPQTQVRVTVYASDKSGSTFVDDRSFEGHLFSNLEGYENFIRLHVPLISEFSADKSERSDAPMFPYWALREGFRNALIHRDYSSYHGRVMVSMYPRRMDIWSFGELPKGLTIHSLKRVDRSLPVNPDIAQVVFLKGLVELLGRGTRKIVEEFRSLGFPEPVWKIQAGGISLAMRGGGALRGLPSELNIRQIDLLRRIRPGNSSSIKSFREDNGGVLSERTARNDLTGLVKLGFLARQGQGKNTFYVRTEKPIA